MTKKLKIIISLILALSILFIFEAVFAADHLMMARECEMYTCGGERISCTIHREEIDSRAGLFSGNNKAKYENSAGELDVYVVENDGEEKNIKKAYSQGEENIALKEVPEWIVVVISTFMCIVLATMTLAIVKLKSHKK